MGSKTFAVCLAAVLVAAASTASAQSPQQPTGSWANETSGNYFYMGASASDGTYLYFCGGYQYGVTYTYPYYYQQCTRYDPANNTWATLAQLPNPLYYCAGAYYGGRVFAIGGYNLNYGYSNAIFAYTISSDSWATLSATLSSTRYYPAAATLGDRIYVTGGYYNGYTATNDEFNPTNDSVATRASMPGGAYFHSMAAFPALNKVYALGGYNNGYLSICYEYTPPDSSSANGSWTTKSPISNGSGAQPRYGPLAMTLGSRIYVMAGYNSGYQNTALEYNPVTDTWVQRANLTNARYMCGGGVVGGKGYVYGGVASYTANEEFTPPDFGLPPNAPTNVGQSGSRAESALQSLADSTQYDGWTNNQITFSANVTDPNAGQQVRLRVRARPAGSPTWINLDSGLQNQGTITIPWNIPADGSYDWQYRIEDSYSNSYPDAMIGTPAGWVDAFGNGSSPDFRSDQIPPADPIALGPSNVDIDVHHPVGGYATLNWTESTDNGPVAGISYEIQVARDGGFIDIEAQLFSTAGTSSYPVYLTVSRYNKYWRLRARDVGGNYSNWSPPLIFRIVYDDQLDHGAGDAKRNCGFGTPAGAPLGAAALCGLGLAVLGLAFQRRSPKI